MPLAAGTRLGPYVISGQLGAGGMGEVYKATDSRLDRTVAIKVLPAEVASDPERRARFEREARAIAALNHPHICTLYDIGCEDGIDYLVLEYLEGQTLAERLGRSVPTKLAQDEVLTITSEVVDALERAHGQGIVHRDLKPANIFLTKSGVKLLDFGLATQPLDGTTRMGTSPGMVVGTVAYMSPEQARGEAVDHRTDIWALGAILYEMLEGRPAFSGNSPVAIALSITQGDPAPLAGSAPALQALVGRCLQKDRARRCQHTSEIGAALASLRSAAGSAGLSNPSDRAARSLAVLPFTNLSADPDQQFFCDGLTDEIITDLSHIRNVSVISRNSSQQLKHSGADLKAVASRLGVHYVLDGSVRKAAGTIRVSAHLVDAVKDEYLWADKYSGRLEDVFEIQERISRSIVDALAMTLTPEEDRRLGEHPFTNVEAFECYHRARHEIYTFTERGLDRAVELIDKASAIVGDHELLQAAKGTVYFQYVNAALKDDNNYSQQVEACAQRIFALKPGSPHGLSVLGLARLSQGRQPEAVQLFKRAIAIDPHSYFANMELGRIYESAGRYSDAKMQYLKGLLTDPLSPIGRGALLSNEMMAGHLDVALRELPAMVQAVPPFGYLRWTYAVSLIAAGRSDEARGVLEEMPEEPEPTIAGRCCVFLRLALQGNRDGAAASLGAALSARARRVEWWSGWIAECYAFIDEQEQAIDWLENAAERGYFPYPYLATHSAIFRRLDGNGRFRSLLARVHASWEAFRP